MTVPSAKIIADSLSPDGVRLTTMEVVIHRFVLAEFNTHRVFSRNSASSRAIPVAKQIERIVNDPALPVVWPAEQKGMQGGEELDANVVARLTDTWISEAWKATLLARRLVDFGLHKSLTNRLLEPFMWHTVVVTSTAWENFFALRTDADAQPEIRQAAVAMQAAYRDHEPTPISHTGWHLPYLDEDSIIEVSRWTRALYPDEAVDHNFPLAAESAAYHYGLLTKICAARCARVSYLTQDGKRDIDADLDLYDRLITDRIAAGLPVHWSPLEHVATPWPKNRQNGSIDPFFIDHDKVVRVVSAQHLPRVGNLLGWRSMRTTVEAIQNERTYR